MQNETLMDLDDRVIFNTELAAPAGYRLGCAVGTTYSLDFETALSVPVCLALSGAANRDEVAGSPLGMFAAMQKLTSKLFLFVETGNIVVPTGKTSRLITMLEPVIHEITPNRESSFHPKVWILRYEPENATDKAKFKLIVMSRNLTRDQSWDASLVLDGVEAEKSDDNTSLIALLELLLHRGNTKVNKALSDLRKSLPNVKWECPKGFRRVRFHLHDGRPGESWLPPRKSNRLAVVSPFIKAEALNRLAQTTSRFEALITRKDQLQSGNKDFPEICDVRVLRDDAVHQSDEVISQPSGLHAKIYVAEEDVGGKNPRTWLTIGSGNATNAGLTCERNVEFFASLWGLTKTVGGIENILGDTGLGQLSQSWEPNDETPEPAGPAETALRKAQQDIVRSNMTLNWETEGDAWRARLVFDEVMPKLPDLVCMHAGLVTFHRDQSARVLGAETLLQPDAVPLTDVTRFVRIVLSYSQEATRELVLKLPVKDLPVENRMDAIIAEILKDASSVLRFIRLMLGEKGALFDNGKNLARTATAQQTGRASAAGQPMFEVLLRAWLARDPAVERIGEVIGRLRKNGHENRVADDLVHLWETLREARVGTAGKL